MKALMSTTRLAPARERLLAAALARFGSEGPAGVTLEDVRSEAGVSVGALYHHFADKSALLDALYVELLAESQSEMVADLREHATAEGGIKAGVRLYLRWVTANRNGAGVLLTHQPDAQILRELNRPFFAEVQAWWDTHVHYGAVRELPLELVTALWLGPAQEYTRRWLAGRSKRMPAAVTTVLQQAAWDALRKEPI